MDCFLDYPSAILSLEMNLDAYESLGITHEFRVELLILTSVALEQ